MPTVGGDHTLVTEGPYEIVRHLGDTDSTMVGLGVLLHFIAPDSWFYGCIGWDYTASKVATGILIVLVVLVPTTLSIRAIEEDRVLGRLFGQQWEAYAKRTPYRIIPHVF